MKKVLIALGLIAAVLIAVVALNLGKDEDTEVEVKEPIVEETVVKGNPDETEEAFQQTLHEMTHQKVHAEAKWGWVEITEDKIERMLATLDVTDFEHEDFYRKALTAWSNGDFSNSVEVHNTIWEIQGGVGEESGKAERMLTPEEEEAYVGERTGK